MHRRPRILSLHPKRQLRRRPKRRDPARIRQDRIRIAPVRITKLELKLNLPARKRRPARHTRRQRMLPRIQRELLALRLRRTQNYRIIQFHKPHPLKPSFFLKTLKLSFFLKTEFLNKLPAET